MKSCKQILLVLEKPDYASQVRAYLSVHLPKAELTLTGSLTEALAFLSGSRPDLILADMAHSDGPGSRLLARTGLEPEWPVLFACNNANEAAALEGLPAVAVDFVIKSSTGIEELPHRICRLLSCWEFSRGSRTANKRRGKSEETLRQILDLVPHHIHAKDSRGRFIMANKAVAESYHMTPEEFVGLSHLDIAMDEQEAYSMLRDDREVIETGRPKHIPEETCVDADGNVHWLETTKVPFENDGEPAVLIVANDITERKRAASLAEMQRDASAGLAAAVTLDEAVHVCLDSTLRISSVDQAGIYLLNDDGGLGLAGQVGRTATSAEMPVHFSSDTEQIREAMRGRPVYTKDRSHLKASPEAESAESHPVLSRASAIIPILHENRAVACMITVCPAGKAPVPMADRLPLEAIAALAGIGIRRLRVEDRLRKTEAQFLQAQKMEAVGHLAGGVAHDFNNLLSAILGYTELSQINLANRKSVDGYLLQVIKAVERARKLVSQLLAFSRKQLLEMKVSNLNNVILNLENMLRRLLGEHILLEANLSLDLWPVQIDTTQMEQVLVNLAINARDAMPNGGRLLIETSNLPSRQGSAKTLPGGKTGDFVKLVVKDYGAGMDAETLTHAFEPFFTTKNKGKGTGLGLSTVYGIINQHHGNIELESLSGAGTTFTVLLPRAQQSQASSAAPITAIKHQNGGTETLLLVEDESVVRSLARDILLRLGYTVLDAGSGPKALKMAHEHRGRIDLLITDVIMPRMNGKELYHQLNIIMPGLRVLYVSGYDGDIISRHGVLAPGINFLTKPFTIDALAMTVRSALDA